MATKQKSRMSKTRLVREALFNGEELTAKNAARKFGVANLPAVISNVRRELADRYNYSTSRYDIDVYQTGKTTKYVLYRG